MLMLLTRPCVQNREIEVQIMWLKDSQGVLQPVSGGLSTLPCTADSCSSQPARSTPCLLPLHAPSCQA